MVKQARLRLASRVGRREACRITNAVLHVGRCQPTKRPIETALPGLPGGGQLGLYRDRAQVRPYRLGILPFESNLYLPVRLTPPPR
jgi:hypothetical protein